MQCISCPRQCDVRDGWHPRLLRQVPTKQMGVFNGDTKDIPVCSKQFGKLTPEDRLNATEAFDFCFNLGCKRFVLFIDFLILSVPSEPAIADKRQRSLLDSYSVQK
jgi:hypothetical protein